MRRTVSVGPLNGGTVVAHFAGAERMVFPGDPGRVIATSIGLRAQLVHRGPGGLLTRDAGFVVLDFTFTILNGEIILQRGPHPSLESLLAGEDTFCATMSSALRLN
jgi:hypothetical protein